MLEFDSLGARQLPEEDRPVDRTFKDEEIYPGDSIVELENEKCFDDLDDIRAFLEHLGATRRVMD